MVPTKAARAPNPQARKRRELLSQTGTRPIHQQANQMKIKAESIEIRSFSGNPDTNATTLRSNGKARNSLNVSIHGPGLGIHFIEPGNIATIK